MDRKTGYGLSSGNYVGYNADLASVTDYYPFGMSMPGRNFEATDYRFGQGTQMKSDEVYGDGSLYTALFWEYDARLGRRWNLDPYAQISMSDYSVLGNNPIRNLDVKGDVFFGLFGSSSEQRSSAKAFAEKVGGSVKNKWGKDIHVDYDLPFSTYDENDKLVDFGVIRKSEYFFEDGTPESLGYQFYLDNQKIKRGEGSRDANGEYHWSPATGAVTPVDDPFTGILGPGLIYAAVKKSMVVASTGFFSKGNWMSGSTILGSDAATAVNASRMVAEDGVYQVLLHGTPEGFIVNGSFVSSKNLARTMLQNGYQRGTPVRLISCHTGVYADGAAYQLSRYLKAPIIAPTNKIRILEGGPMKYLMAEGLGHFLIQK